MVKNAGSRVYHGILVAVCVVLCLVAIISFATFASTHNEFRKKTEEFERQYPGYRLQRCILFAGTGVQPFTKEAGVLLSESDACVLAIWGEVSVALLSLLLGAVFVIKAAIGINARSWFSFVELAVLVLTGLLDFAIAITISVGLDQTCDVFESLSPRIKCSNNAYVIPDQEGPGPVVKFYHNISTSKGTAWVGTGILAIMAAVHFVVVLLYLKYCRQQRRGSSVPYGHLETDATDQEQSKTDKTVAV